MSGVDDDNNTTYLGQELVVLKIRLHAYIILDARKRLPVGAWLMWITVTSVAIGLLAEITAERSDLACCRNALQTGSVLI